MTRECYVCGKRPLKANSISFSNKHHRHRQAPNLQTMKTLVDGVPKKIKICTSCLKADKAKRVY